MPKDQNTFAKRQREMKKKQKAQDKRERRRRKKNGSDDANAPAGDDRPADGQ